MSTTPATPSPWAIWPWTGCPACESGVMYQPVAGTFEGEQRADLVVDGEPWICVNPACRTRGTWTVTDNGEAFDQDGREIMDEAEWNALARPVRIRVVVRNRGVDPSTHAARVRLYWYFERACRAGLCDITAGLPSKTEAMDRPHPDPSVRAILDVDHDLNAPPGLVHVRIGSAIDDFEVLSIGAGVVRDAGVDDRIGRIRAHHRAFFERAQP